MAKIKLSMQELFISTVFVLLLFSVAVYPQENTINVTGRVLGRMNYPGRILKTTGVPKIETFFIMKTDNGEKTDPRFLKIRYKYFLGIRELPSEFYDEGNQYEFTLIRDDACDQKIKNPMSEPYLLVINESKFPSNKEFVCYDLQQLPKRKKIQINGLVVAFDYLIKEEQTTFADTEPQVVIFKLDGSSSDETKYIRLLYDYLPKQPDLSKYLLSDKQCHLSLDVVRVKECDSNLNDIKYSKVVSIETGKELPPLLRLKNLGGLEAIPDDTILPCYKLDNSGILVSKENTHN